MATYSWHEGMLILYDTALPLDLSGPFQPPLLPENPRQGQMIGNHIQVQINYAGNYIYSYSLMKNGCYEGEYRCVYPCGATKGRMFYCQGLLHGPSHCYTPSGQLTSSSWYWQGKQEGEVLMYYASGALYSIQHYLHGLRHTTQHYYYEDGILKTLMNYQHGKLHGITQLYHPDGTIDRLLTFDNGRASHVDIRPPHPLYIA